MAADAGLRPRVVGQRYHPDRIVGRHPWCCASRLSERERTRIEGSFGTVLLIITLFFSIAAPDNPWAELATAVVLAITLSITMLASGAQPRIVPIWLGVARLGSQPFFTSQERGTPSDYMYFSFITLATVGYDDLTPQGGIGRTLAVTEGLSGQIYLVTAVAALVGNMGRERTPRQ